MTPRIMTKLNGEVTLRVQSFRAPLAGRQHSGGTGKAFVPGLSSSRRAEILMASPQTRSLCEPNDALHPTTSSSPTGSHPEMFDMLLESSPPPIGWVSFKREDESREEVVFSSMVVTAQQMLEWLARLKSSWSSSWEPLPP